MVPTLECKGQMDTNDLLNGHSMLVDKKNHFCIDTQWPTRRIFTVPPTRQPRLSYGSPLHPQDRTINSSQITTSRSLGLCDTVPSQSKGLWAFLRNTQPQPAFGIAVDSSSTKSSVRSRPVPTSSRRCTVTACGTSTSSPGSAFKPKVWRHVQAQHKTRPALRQPDHASIPHTRHQHTS